ncbi:MAG: hypothetical protein A2503_10075 [Burkholderiales bacterium RIFOXYD12_FULL_59_19]|nr:MAG: hypothetical protein A2503_10075 [Burkholderiales bacterium RIFOXYD12_FULL_59_19]
MRDVQKQENSGAGAVQIHGNHNTVNHHTHQHSHTHQHTLHAHGPVVLQLSEQAFALQAPPAPPARQGRQRKPPKRDVTPAQREVLALMRPLPKAVRVDVLIWMRYEFGTSLVLDLEPRELHQLRGHVLDVRRAAGV